MFFRVVLFLSATYVLRCCSKFEAGDFLVRIWEDGNHHLQWIDVFRRDGGSGLAS